MRIEDGFEGYSLQSGASHEAGFDALMTGVSFMKLISVLDEKNRMKKDLITEHAHILNTTFKDPIALRLDSLSTKEDKHRNSVFALKNVPLDLMTEDIEKFVGENLCKGARIYRQFQRNFVLVSVYDEVELAKMQARIDAKDTDIRLNEEVLM